MSQLHSYEILRRAEMCWRQHNVLMMVAGATIDACKRDNNFTKDSALAHLVSSCPVFSELFEIANALLDDSLTFHPRVVGRIDLLSRASSFVNRHAHLYPLAAYEVAKYFECSGQDLAKLLKRSILAHPSILHLYYALRDLSPNTSKKLFILKRLHELGITWDSELPIAYTPLVDMAIGHMGALIDTRKYIWEQRLAKGCTEIKDVWIESEYSACDSLKGYLGSHGRPEYSTIDHINIKSLSSVPLCLITQIYNCNPFPQSFSNHSRSLRHKGSFTAKPSSCVIHLRTGNYKYNDNNPGMGDRSVDPRAYRKLCRALAKAEVRVSHITADSPPIPIDAEVPMVFVNDLPSQIEQWRLFFSSDFVVGTQSGISHLAGLTLHGGYLTNYSLLPTDMDLGPNTMLHCKRLEPLDSVRRLTSQERLALFVQSWSLGTECLSQHCSIRRLHEDELAKGVCEYLESITISYWPWTLHCILEAHGLNAFSLCLPEVRLAKSTYDDLHSLLSYS